MSSPSLIPHRPTVRPPAPRSASGWWLILGTASVLQAQSPDASRLPDPAPSSPRHEERGEVLNPEERRQLHEALSQAWEDPEVVRARQEVHRATEAYRRVLRDTVTRIDPDVVPLMGQLHEKSRVEAMRHKLPPDSPFPPWVFPPLPPEPAAAVEALAQAEARFRSLEGPDRDHFLRVAKRLGEAGTLRSAFPPSSEREKEKNGRESFKNRRELRDRFLKEMARSDARVAELLAGSPRPMLPPPPSVKGPVPTPPTAP